MLCCIHCVGVLYLDDGGDPTACTQFYDVRGQKAELGAQKLGGGDAAGLFRPVWEGTNAPVQVCPEVGTLVLFPAWLQHAVLPHKGDRTRLTISWNLVLVCLGHMTLFIQPVPHMCRATRCFAACC